MSAIASIRSTALPLAVDDLTAGWFTSVLTLPAGVTVAVAEIESIIWGTATKVFVPLGYSGPGDAGSLPASVCVKGGFNPDLRPMAAPGYLAEARFFGELAPRLGVPLPRCWFAGEDPDNNQGIVVLEDLRDVSASFPTMVDPISVDVVAKALELQASWHARTWDGAQLAGSTWLTLGSPVQGIIRIMLGEDHWQHHMNLPRGEVVPPSMLDREQVLVGFEALWARDDAAPTALSHGDAHMGNLYLVHGSSPGGSSEAPDPSFLDWQGVCRAPWSDDVTYLIGGALSVEDRRASEADLLAHYLKALGSEGVDAPDYEMAWDDYRRHHLHGFVWLLVPDAMQPEPVCRAMGERYAVACDDHGVFEALGV